MKATTRARWAGLVDEWKRSGKTAAQFAEGQPFSAGTLTWRACQLRQTEAVGERKREAKRPGRRGANVVLAEVVRRRATESSRLLLEVAGVRIEVERGFDETLLRQVVLAVREGRV